MLHNELLKEVGLGIQGRNQEAGATEASCLLAHSWASSLAHPQAYAHLVFLFYFVLILYVSVCSVFVCKHVCGCPQRPQEAVRSSGVGIIGIGSHWHGCWELNSGLQTFVTFSYSPGALAHTTVSPTVGLALLNQLKWLKQSMTDMSIDQLDENNYPIGILFLAILSRVKLTANANRHLMMQLMTLEKQEAATAQGIR